MRRIFSELYDGNISFDSPMAGQDSAFVKAARAKNDSKEKLTASLDDTGRELFEAYCDAADVIEDIMRFDTFSRALRFGTMFMLEVFTVGAEPPDEGGEPEE